MGLLSETKLSLGSLSVSMLKETILFASTIDFRATKARDVVTNSSFPRSLRQWLLLVIVFNTLSYNSGAAIGTRGSKTMPDSAAEIQTSKSHNDLFDIARRLAQSNHAADHNELRKLLSSPKSLTQIDGPERYQGAPEKLRLSEVIRELTANPAPSAAAVLIALTETPNFLAQPLRVELLIRALVAFRPAPAAVTRFWDRHWISDDGYSHVTAVAVCDNGSAPALALLEKKMSDPSHTADDKRVWMVTGIMIHRNEVAMLETCQRLLRVGLPKRLRPLLVEVLFDYRPTEWFHPAKVLVPPDRKLASAAARERLRLIGEDALKSVPLSQQQQQVVRDVLKEI